MDVFTLMVRTTRVQPISPIIMCHCDGCFPLRPSSRVFFCALLRNGCRPQEAHLFTLSPHFFFLQLCAPGTGLFFLSCCVMCCDETFLMLLLLRNKTKKKTFLVLALATMRIRAPLLFFRLLLLTSVRTRQCIFLVSLLFNWACDSRFFFSIGTQPLCHAPRSRTPFPSPIPQRSKGLSD